jgi:hypothetical protein
MSTRATYQFLSDRGKATLYIHQDGYPEGAAQYLQAAIDCENQQGGWVERMIRANDGAEITTSHEAHGDTEHRYTIGCCSGSPAAISWQKREGGEGTHADWVRMFGGTVEAFIKVFLEEDMDD